MRRRTRLDARGMAELLNSTKVGDMLEARMSKALAFAKSNAPVATGAYRDSLHIEVVHTDRVVARIVAGTDHALWVEAQTGNLARALDAAR
jgi:hypothetical protein